MSAESLAVRPAPTTVQGVAGGGMSLKPGKSILEQIGTPDHNGWMRKKGDHYNTWKLRYFVLKGPHLYCLRSNNASVSTSFWFSAISLPVREAIAHGLCSASPLCFSSLKSSVQTHMATKGNQNQGLHKYRRV